MEWISINDKPVSEQVIVILYRGDYPKFIGVYCSEEYEIFDETDEPTHWMPTPEPPKE